MSAILTIQSIRKAFGIHVILDDISFAVHERDRIGIVGLNGAGKSTLMRVVVEDDADEGLITRQRDLVLRYVPQEPHLDETATIADILAEATRSEPHERREVAHAMGLQGMERTVGTLSGGEKRRVAIARAILDHPGLLALDEPTNHLDAQTVEWLEAWLRDHDGAVLLVTHDRYFLDRVATRILELDRGSIYAYEGNYQVFLEKQSERRNQDSERDRKRAAFITRELAWVRRKAAAQIKKGQARIDRFEAIVADGPKGESRTMDLRLSTGGRLGKTILELKKVTRGNLFKDLTLLMKPGDRIGIVGPNGAGKTTLIRTILGEIKPDRGEVVLGVNTKIAYLDQGRVELDDSRTVIDEVSDGNEAVFLADGPVHVRSFLRMLLFEDRDATKRIGSLSGGERNRVMLAKLLKAGGNLLVLDEPTNDLDLMTLGVLEDALANFGGCALVVSHDRWFLDRVATGILAFEGDGKVVFYEGNYSEWLARRPNAAGAGKSVPRSLGTAAPKSAPSARLSYREKQELAAIEAEIITAEGRVEALSTEISEVTGPEAGRVARELGDAVTSVEGLYARWQQLESRNG